MTHDAMLKDEQTHHQDTSVITTSAIKGTRIRTETRSFIAALNQLRVMVVCLALFAAIHLSLRS